MIQTDSKKDYKLQLKSMILSENITPGYFNTLAINLVKTEFVLL